MRMHQMYAAAILVLVFAGFVAAKDEPAKVERITYRLTGLFSSDREKDLREGLKVLEDIKLIAVNYEDAEVTLEFAPNKLFPGQKPERVTELVDEKVRSVTRHTFGIKPRRTLPRDKLQKVTIQVGGLDCKACALAAYEALAQDDGVMQATVNFKEGKATALFDPTKTDKAKLEEALKRKGVDVPGAKK